jgi:FPC/CPF motif-containing protein YcgG
MPAEVELSRVESLFAELRYPVTRDDAAAEFADTTVRFADGEANLGKLVSEVGSDSFTDPEDLYAELQTVLPVEAVGEPGQSEGDA